MPEIFPSLISADILNLESEIKKFDPLCAGYHIDIMDNNFVPNLTWGSQFANAIAHCTNKKTWVHLMVEKPEILFSKLLLPEGSIVTFHIEHTSNKKNLVKQIKEKNCLPSIAINPKTPVSELFTFLDKDIHQILLMSVEPGFSGQQFIPEVIDKIEPLILFREANNLNFKLSMDGGINEKNIVLISQKGVEQFGIASGIFAQADPVTALNELTKLI